MKRQDLEKLKEQAQELAHSLYFAVHNDAQSLADGKFKEVQEKLKEYVYNLSCSGLDAYQVITFFNYLIAQMPIVAERMSLINQELKIDIQLSTIAELEDE